MHREFPLDTKVLYLNHAAIAPWPKRTVDAVSRFADELSRIGSKRYAQWLSVEQRLRERCATLIGATSAEEIALLKSTSEGLSFVAQGLHWQDGDNIVTITQEFPSNRIVWETLAERGVALRSLDLGMSKNTETDLLALCDTRTRLLAISWVQYGRGQRLDIGQLAAECKKRGVLLCVDAIQGLGVRPFALSDCPADFIVADGHKWMLGPEGLALFWCRPELRDELRLTEFGWHMVEDMGDFDRTDWAPAKSARRFECGSPNMLGIHALEASLSLLEETGIDVVSRAVEDRIAHLAQLIDAAGFELLSPRDPGRRAGILTFRVPGADQPSIYRGLMQRGVMCASRGGGIRFSPHFYTPEPQLVAAIDAAKAVAREAT